MVGFNRRFDPSFKARARAHPGRRDRQARAGDHHQRDPGPPPVAYIRVSGGLFRDMTIHDFDMARYLMGDIVAVQAIGANLVDPAIAEAGDIDAAMITLVAASGAICQINNSRRSAYGYDQRVEAFGERGMLQAGNQRPTTLDVWGAAATEAKDPVLNFFIERYPRPTTPRSTTSSTASRTAARPGRAIATAARRCRPAAAAPENEGPRAPAGPRERRGRGTPPPPGRAAGDPLI